ncbi:ADGRB3 [Branchiostoma lanceolatum]|uniref:ADGRB3 protein n=1 Tax=Branchiostoma lanceolatum TaxID=7740 RepID=A0A8K0EHE2_BRALA|nr:ADGRB3 [Branchiostoma lanceolatum]
MVHLHFIYLGTTCDHHIHCKVHRRDLETNHDYCQVINNPIKNKNAVIIFRRALETNPNYYQVTNNQNKTTITVVVFRRAMETNSEYCQVINNPVKNTNTLVILSKAFETIPDFCQVTNNQNKTTNTVVILRRAMETNSEYCQVINNPVKNTSALVILRRDLETINHNYCQVINIPIKNKNTGIILKRAMETNSEYCQVINNPVKSTNTLVILRRVFETNPDYCQVTNDSIKKTNTVFILRRAMETNPDFCQAIDNPIKKTNFVVILNQYHFVSIIFHNVSDVSFIFVNRVVGAKYNCIIMRECGMDGVWQTPDTTECRSRQAAELLEKANTTLTKLETMQQITPANVDMMGQLAEAMEDATNTSGGYIPTANDLQLYTNITSSLVRVFEMANETVSYTRLRRYAQSVVNVFSNMIAPPNREVWSTVSKFTQDSCGGCSCVMEQAEKLARSLARNLPTDGTFNTQTEIHSIRIHIELKKVSVSAQSVDLTFPRETSEFLGQIKPSPVNIPASVLRAARDSVKESSVYYIAYRDLQSCLPAITMGKYRGYTIQAQVVAAGVHPQPKAPFSQNVSIGHWHLTNEPNETACTWWDFETRNWTDRGCTVDPSMSNNSHTHCVCNHLTNFALLMSPFHKTSPIVSKALKYITIIGCGISFIFLFITAVAHLTLWRFVKKDSARAHIHVNLCISLAIGNLVIIISEIVDPGITVLCTVIAVFLHYFYLAAMTWMLCEGIQLYMSIVHVFRRSNKLVRRAYYAAGWGVPLVIVAITIGVTQAAGYGNQVAADGSPEALIETNGTTEATNDGRVSNNNGEDEHCWLVVDNGVRWSFIGPAIFIIAVNLIIMVIVLKTMLGNRALQNAEQWTRTKAGVRASFVMLPLLGLSWLLGVFSINEQTSAAFGLLFAIVNSLQGLFVFIFHCLRSKTINDAIDKKNGRGGSSFRKSNLSKTISRQSSSDPRATMKRVKGSVLVRRLFPSKKDDRRRQYSGSGTNSLSVPSTPPKTRKEERKSSSDSGFSISSLVRKLRGSLSSENADESTSGDSGVADLNRSPDRSRRSSLSSTPHMPTTLTWAPTLDLEQPPVAPPRTKRQRASATLMPTPTLPTLVECSPYSTVNSITNVTTTAQVEPNQVDIDFTRPLSPENDPTSLIQPSAELVDEQHSNGNGLRRVASAPVKKHPKKKTRQSLRDTIVNIPEDASAEMETSDSPPEDDVSDYSSVFEELHEVTVRRRSLPKLEDWKNVL